MPQQKTPRELPLYDLESQAFLDPRKTPTAPQALALVCRTYEQWSNWRQASQDPKWELAKDLYAGRVDPKFWDDQGKYPRSSVPIRIVYDHSNTAATKINLAVFGREPYWFDIVDGNDVKGASELRHEISYYLESAPEGKASGVAHLNKLVGNHFVPLGTGMSQVGWDARRQQPFLRHLDPRKVYISPEARMGGQSTPAWILRETMTIGDIKQLDKKVFDIPSDDVLFYMARNRAEDVGGRTIRSAQGQLGIMATESERETNPWDSRIEVLAYESKQRIIWIFNRQWVAYNIENPFGFMTLDFANYSDVDESPYGEGVAGLLASEQLVQQAITNAYIDEVSLNLNPPRIRTSAQNSKPGDRVFRPGLEIVSQSPKDDYQVKQVGQVTGDGLTVIGMSQQRASARTGMSSMAITGTPTPSNANRTAGGVSSQASASNERLLTAIGNLQNYLVTPQLQKCAKILDLMRGGATQERKIKVFGGSRVMAREQLAPILPLLFQYALNPEINSKLQAMGKTVDFEEMNRLVQEATGIAEKYSIFRDVTPEEQQQMQQSQQAEQQAKMQEKLLEAQTRNQVTDKNNQTKMQVEELKALSRQNETAEQSAGKIAEVMLKGRAIESQEKIAEMKPKADKS